MLFQNIFNVQEHITTVFVFAVFLISLSTEGYIYGLISAVLSMLAIIAIAILVFSKVMYSFSKKKEEKETVVETSANNVAGATVSGTPLADGNSAGKLDLVDVDESTAAVIMAIVSDQSGIPLNRLNFKSIKKVEDK